VDAYGALVSIAGRVGHPTAPLSRAFLARVSRSAREQARAEEEARSHVWAKPQDPDARRALALALLRRGDLRGAADHLAAATALPGAGAVAGRELKRVRATIALLQ
jgi:hypothetical protein